MSNHAAQLQARVDALEAELSAAHQEIRLLRQKIDHLSRKLFGVSSEKLSADQLQLLLELAGAEEPKNEEPEEPEPPRAVAHRPRKPSKPRIPDHLPVVEEVIDPEPVKAQPDQWRQIGEEVTEQLDYEPARFVRRRLIRRKYVHRTEKDFAPVIAPLPPSLQERCLATPGLLAQVVVGKYCDHLPLYRQEDIFKRRHGVDLPRQTLCNWMELVADWLQPIYGHLQKEVFDDRYVQIDETPVRYLAPGNGKTKHGYLWTAHRPGSAVMYHWETSRAAKCLDNVLPVDFEGTVQCDGYRAYETMARQRGGKITLADCWAHARRKFVEATESAPRTAGWFLNQIGHLYRIEEQLRSRQASPKLRQVIRSQEGRMITERIGKACRRLLGSRRHLPQSHMGKAINYTLNQWAGLQVFLENGQVEIDNNLVENAIRPTAVGKKNWLFIGAGEAGGRSAVLYTIIENCRREGINPFDYLKGVLTRLPKMTNHQTHTVTPKAWAKEQSRKPAPLKQAS